MPEILILIILVGVFIVPTFYGLYRAAVTKQWGWFWGILIGWFFGLGWLIGIIFIFADRKRVSAN